MKQVLSRRSLWIIGAAESVSGIGDWITMMAVLALLIFRGDGSVMASSGVFLAGLLPIMIFSPLAGWLVDRINRKTLLIGSQVLAGIVISGLVFTTRNELIYAILALEAVVLSVVSPTRQAVIPDLVNREEFEKANAFLMQLSGLVKIFSPVIAGMVLSLMDPHAAILFDVASFFVSAAILCFLPSLPPHTDTSVKSARKEAANPMKVLQGIPTLRLLFVGVFFTTFIIVGFDVLSSIYTRDFLHQGEKVYGFAISLVGIGSLGATAALMLRKKRSAPWKDIILGFVLLNVIPLTLVFSFHVGDLTMAMYLMMAACLIGGIGNSLAHVQIGTITQLVTPAPILGQVSGWLQMVMVSGQLIGMLLAPALVPGLVNMQTYFLGMVILLSFLIVFLSIQVSGKARLIPGSVPSDGEVQ
ncbi:MAG: MFS transporter [Leptolinea sp.]|jgi:MFS family permease|nr:MFS transporter [Leptolinea sp.]